MTHLTFRITDLAPFAASMKRKPNREAQCIRLVRPSGKLFQDGLREKLVDLAMPGDWLRHACAGILVPIVFPSMSNENAPYFLYLLHEVPAFHATSNSATFRTAGMCPPDKSAYKSRKCS